MFDFGDELEYFALALDAQLPLVHGDFQVAGGEGAGEHHLSRVLADVDETARAGDARTEFRDVEIAVPVDLGQPQHRDVQATAIVEIELVGLIDDGLDVGGGAEIQPAGGNAAHHARFGGEGQQIDDLFLGGDVGDTLGHTDAQIHDGVWRELQRGPAGDDLALAHRDRGDRGQRHLDFAGKGGVVWRGESLPVMFRG